MNFKKYIVFIISIVSIYAIPTTQGFSNAFIEVAKIGNPSVVSIVSKKVIDSNYHNFFSPNDSRSSAMGSGVIINKDEGFIITNNHVIDNSDNITVILFNKREIDAIIVATDPLSDLAVLKVSKGELSEAKIGNSDRLQAGEWVVAIGSPFGLHLNHTVTAGIVSATGRSSVVSRNNFEDFIQHDAAINPGNSGGALFNLDGELVGINTAIATDGFSKANAGVGFAIPINMVLRVIEDLISNGKVNRGWLGVQIQDVDESMARALKLDERYGAIISHVIKNSPAEEGGIQSQDVIIEVDGSKVIDSANLKNLISGGHPKDITKIIVVRNGEKKSLNITLGTRPDESNLSLDYRLDKFDLLGLKVEDIKIPDFKKNYYNGVKIINIEQGSSASSDINIGDVIIEIGQKTIKNINDYKSELDNYTIGDTIMLRILRNEDPLYVAFEIK
jgi:serine protease Do